MRGGEMPHALEGAPHGRWSPRRPLSAVELCNRRQATKQIRTGWAAKHGLGADLSPNQLDVSLDGGGVFRFAEYLQELRDSTDWIARDMEDRLGMKGFIETYQTNHAPDKVWKAARTIKSFVFQEAESFSRDAKAEWAGLPCEMSTSSNGPAAQHDAPLPAVGLRRALAEHRPE